MSLHLCVAALLSLVCTVAAQSGPAVGRATQEAAAAAERISTKVDSAIVNDAYTFALVGCRVVIVKRTPILCEVDPQRGIEEVTTEVSLGEMELNPDVYRDLLTFIPKSQYSLVSEIAHSEMDDVFSENALDPLAQMRRISNRHSDLFLRYGVQTHTNVKACVGEEFDFVAALSDMAIRLETSDIGQIAADLAIYAQQYCR